MGLSAVKEGKGGVAPAFTRGGGGDSESRTQRWEKGREVDSARAGQAETLRRGRGRPLLGQVARMKGTSSEGRLRGL